MAIVSQLIGSLNKPSSGFSMFLLNLSASWSTLITLKSIIFVVVLIELLVEIVEGHGVCKLVPWVVAILLLFIETSTSWGLPIALAVILLGWLWTPAITSAMQARSESRTEEDE